MIKYPNVNSLPPIQIGSWDEATAFIEVEGALACQTSSYHPAVFTAADDDTLGDTLVGISTHNPTGNFYANPAILANGSVSLSNVRINYAAQAVLMEDNCNITLSDSQVINSGNMVVLGFGDGDSGPVTLTCNNCLYNSTDALVILDLNDGGDTYNLNNCTIDNVCYLVYGRNPNDNDGNAVNCIFANMGNVASWGGNNNGFYNSSPFGYPSFTASTSPFQTVGEGSFYLANNPFRGRGWTGISSSLLADLKTKTTYPPIALPAWLRITGDLALFPQVPRYATGGPDLGYYYPALDYTVANIDVAGGGITVEPGTAIAVRNDYLPAQNEWTLVGFWLEQGSSITAHGTPTAAITFTSTKMVQEQPETAFAQYNDFPFSVLSFVPYFVPNALGSPPPTLDFRFCNFDLPSQDYHIGAGLNENNSIGLSPDSAVYLSIRDCNLCGGRFNLGKTIDESTVFGAGTVSLTNNLFDRVAVNLDPNWADWGDSTIYVDLGVRADNNLFRGGAWLHLDPFPATAGNWLFENNLFDQVDFYQNANEPLDFDYNGYWPLTTLYGNGDTAELVSTTTGDGFTDGTAGNHEVVLHSAPSYQSGPLGNYYLPTSNNPLYHAGNTTAPNLGLYHYTTTVNQAKEANNTASIGLHYIAVNNSGQPIDTDGDGIPDYVENWHGDGNYSAHIGTETDWQNAKTDGVNLDPFNATYLDIDLSGDGLTGRAKGILGVNPLSSSNPLTLNPVISGEEPYFLSFSMPLSANIDSSQGDLELLDNGQPVICCDFVQQANGTYLVQLNSTFENNGPHIFQVALLMPGSVLPLNNDGTYPTQPVLSVCGPTSIANVNNIIQFDPDDTPFGSQVVYSGTLAVQSADYEIDIYDTSGNELDTITGYTDNGTLNEIWSPTSNNDEFDAEIYITPTGSQSSGPIPIWRFKKGICGDLFTLAFSWNAEYNSSHSDRSDMIAKGVQNVIFNPALDNQYYSASINSYNCYDCDPFFMWTRSDQNTLLNILVNQSVGNFYYCGHGDDNSIGSAVSDAESEGGTLSCLNSTDVGEALGNFPPIGWKSKGPKYIHPYRFVMLEACECGSTPLWAEAFGIPNEAHNLDWFQAHGEPSQAMVGWVPEILMPSGLFSEIEFDSGEEHLSDFFNAWMSDDSLTDCLDKAATPDSRWGPFGWYDCGQ